MLRGIAACWGRDRVVVAVTALPAFRVEVFAFAMTSFI
jgi:hypothetical protein